MNLSPQDLQELTQLEERLWIAKFRFDQTWMENIFAEDFFEFGRSGRIYSRDDCLRIPPAAIDTILPFPDFKVHLLSHDIAQTTYKSITTEGHTIECANRSSIWMRTASGWKLKFHQGTPTA